MAQVIGFRGVSPASVEDFIFWLLLLGTFLDFSVADGLRSEELS